MLTKKVFFTRRLQGVTLHCCSSWSCYIPRLLPRRITSKHRGCASLRSRTSSYLQLPHYWDVPHKFPATEDIPAGLDSQAHLSAAPPVSLSTKVVHAISLPRWPSLWFRKLPSLILLSIDLGECDKSRNYQGSPLPLAKWQKRWGKMGHLMAGATTFLQAASWLSPPRLSTRLVAALGSLGLLLREPL